MLHSAMSFHSSDTPSPTPLGRQILDVIACHLLRKKQALSGFNVCKGEPISDMPTSSHTESKRYLLRPYLGRYGCGTDLAGDG